ncbi:unnamed protein product [Prorocentrum cordatum]|uniref:Uncharacterized protein n=1 Tax=Prorocentrum cordatum TaxID=2364126 RepID=A0ABN9TFD8_9DINO|nr:unnamed protein product [Polarella glacialis]
MLHALPRMRRGRMSARASMTRRRRSTRPPTLRSTMSRRQLPRLLSPPRVACRPVLTHGSLLGRTHGLRRSPSYPRSFCRALVAVVSPASLRAEAASYVPAAAAAPAVTRPTASRGDLEALAAQLEYALCLLAAQNDTIAQLYGELEARVHDSHAHRGCGDASDPYKYSDTAVEDLHAVVKAMLTSFRDVCRSDVESIMSKSVTSIVRSSMNELMQSVDAVRDAVAASCAASASLSASCPPLPRSCTSSLSAAASRGAAPCGRDDAPHMRPARLRRGSAELCPVCGGSEFFISDDIVPCFCSGSPPAGFFACGDDGDWCSGGRWSQ